MDPVGVVRGNNGVGLGLKVGKVVGKSRSFSRFAAICLWAAGSSGKLEPVSRRDISRESPVVQSMDGSKIHSSSLLGSKEIACGGEVRTHGAVTPAGGLGIGLEPVFHWTPD